MAGRGGGGCPDRAIWEVTLQPRLMIGGWGHEGTWGLETFVFGALKGVGHVGDGGPSLGLWIP